MKFQNVLKGSRIHLIKCFIKELFTRKIHYYIQNAKIYKYDFYRDKKKLNINTSYDIIEKTGFIEK